MTRHGCGAHRREIARACFNFIHHYPSVSNPTTAALMFLQ